MISLQLARIVWDFVEILVRRSQESVGGTANSTIEKVHRNTSSSSRSITKQECSPEVELRLNNLVRDAVSQGLAHFGGRNVVESLIYILELEHSVNLRNIVNELDALRLGFEKMFGEAAYVVEEKVRNNLAKNLGLDPEGRTIEQLIEAAKKGFQ